MDKLNVLGDKAEDRGLRGLYVLVTVNGEGIVADSRDLREDFKQLLPDKQLSVAKCLHAYLANLFAQLDGVGTDICRFLGSVPQEWNRHVVSLCVRAWIHTADRLWASFAPEQLVFQRRNYPCDLTRWPSFYDDLFIKAERVKEFKVSVCDPKCP